MWTASRSGRTWRVRILGTHCAGRPRSNPGCGSARLRSAGARICSLWSCRCRSSRCAGTSTRGFASAGSEGWTRRCSLRAASTGSGWGARSGTASSSARSCPEAGQGALALQVRSRRRAFRGGGEPRGDSRAGSTLERACVAAIGGGCLASIAAHHDGETLTALVADPGRPLGRAPQRRRPGRARVVSCFALARVKVIVTRPRAQAGATRRASRAARSRGRRVPVDRRSSRLWTIRLTRGATTG